MTNFDTTSKYLETNAEGKSGIKVSIEEVLNMIHTEFPSYNFPKCKPQLMDHGICYPITALMFNPMFYTEKIRMNKGEGNLFSMWVQKEVKKADELEKGEGKGKKCAWVEDSENIDT